jgi:Fe-S cluster assembly protein SufB/Fe-S cluster assembly protein SufD
MTSKKHHTQRSDGPVAKSLQIAPNEQRTVFFSFDGDAPHECNVTVAHHADLHVIVFAMGSGSIIYRSSLAEGAHIHWHIITCASESSHHDLISECQGDDAESTIDWVFLARDDEKMEISVQNVFLGKRGRGEVTMKGVAEGKGNVQARGLIKIGPEGSQTDTYLTEDVLMLDPTAKVDAIPALEIKTNDVKASHSATVSRVTEEDLFYFASRGIDQKTARKMFVEGFLHDLLDRIDDASVHDKIAATIHSIV